MYNDRIKNMSKDDFNIVPMDGRTADKGFEGKPRSSFKDSIIRFSKNKINLAASIIVALMVLLSIFVPMISNKDFTSDVVQNIQNLPPRVPILEKIGIADGSTVVTSVSVDHNKIDPNSGLLLPLGDTYDPEYIKKGSLKNTVLTSTRKEPQTLHGQSVMYLDAQSMLTVKSGALEEITSNSVLNVEVKNITNNTNLTIYLDSNATGDLSSDAVLLGEVTSTGIHSFNIEDTHVDKVISLVYEKSPLQDTAQVELVEIEIKDANNESLHYFEGYSLSQFVTISIPGQGGRYERINGEYTVASFKYFMYNKIFANVNIKIPGKSSTNVVGFNDYLVEYPELGEEFAQFDQLILDNTPTNGSNNVVIDYTFEATGVPIRKVNSVTINYNKFLDDLTYTYDIEMDGAFYNGFDSMPYFLFGTDKDGRDLFAQIWLSLRTSLLLGVIVSIINIVIGVIYGAIEGYYGGKVDFIMERIADYIASFPGLTILTIIYLNYGPGLALLLIYLTYSGWIGTASTTRIQFYRYRGREYVLASKSMGATDRRLIFKHILPNAIGIIITRSILSIPSMIFVEASLSFLGFGIGRGVTLNFGLFKMPGLSLGVILQEGQSAMLIPGRFYQLLIPSIVIIVLMISFNMFGNALRDAFNPTLRGQQE